jgi:hypothetical protein
MKDPDPGCERFSLAQPGGATISGSLAFKVVEKGSAGIELGHYYVKVLLIFSNLSIHPSTRQKTK